MTSLVEIYRRFPDRGAAIAHLEQVRWPNGIHCPACGADTVARKAEKSQLDRLQCWSCERSFSATVGTIFHNSHIDLQRWFLLISLMLNAKKGLSAKQAARDLEMRRATVWSMMHRIRAALVDDGTYKYLLLLQIAIDLPKSLRHIGARPGQWRPARPRNRSVTMPFYIKNRQVSQETFFAEAGTATDVRVYNCHGLTALPDLPNMTSVWVSNCPGLTALPDLPAATSVGVWNCPGLTALPDLPAATSVGVSNCPGLTALPDLPAATNVRVWNCPGLTALPDLPNVTDVWVDDCPGLTALPDLPAATDVRVYDCPGLTALPDLPNVTDVWVENCPGLTALPDLPNVRYVQVYSCSGLTAAAAAR
jgi:transposase-like protein